MSGYRLCAGALLATLALTVVLLGHPGALRASLAGFQVGPAFLSVPDSAAPTKDPLTPLQQLDQGRVSTEDQGALQMPPEFGRRLGSYDYKSCKGTPSSKQQLRGEILDVICEKIGKPGANFLIFGLGRDSPFWFSNLGEGGKITFLENHQDWVKFQSDEIKARTHIITYTSKIENYRETLQDENKLKELLDALPQDVKDTKWDTILVDSPMGHKMKGVPGRMQSVYAARELAHSGTTIFVDDFERLVEAASATKLLGPFADRTEVYSNGHTGKTAMYIMARS